MWEPPIPRRYLNSFSKHYCSHATITTLMQEQYRAVKKRFYLGEDNEVMSARGLGGVSGGVKGCVRAVKTDYMFQSAI